jgi:flagellin-like hook-associated protein FlgL
MNELAVQSSNDTYTVAQRGYLNQEFQQLKQQIIQVAETCQWNGINLLNGKANDNNLPTYSAELMPSVSLVQGSNTQNESGEVIFKALNPGQSVTVAGLTYTATTPNSAQDVANAFSNLNPNTNSNSIPPENKVKGTFQGTLMGFGSKPQNSVLNIDNRKFPTYIEFFDSDQTGKSISLKEDAVANIANGSVSIVNGKLMLGDGTKATLIGQIDPAFDGTNGVIRFNYVREFGNFNFDSGSVGSSNITDWTPTNSRIKLDGTSTLAGYPTLIDSTTANGGLEASSVASSSFSVNLSNDTPSGQGLSVKLTSNLNGVVNTPSGIGGVVHGPALTSNSSVRLNAGDAISFDWKATGGSDAYDVAAYIVDANTGETELLLDKTGGGPGSAEFYSDWRTQNHTILKSGEYKFSFVSGSWDATGGTVAGATLYIDNINIEVNTPFEFSASQIQSINSKLELTQEPVNLEKTVFTSATPHKNVRDLRVSANANDTSVKTDRFNFKVGENEDQFIHLTIANFGQDGDITGAITNEQVDSNILTFEASAQVINDITYCLDQISSARSSMGAVMNQLEFALDNASKFAVNAEASRSHVEDTNYAQASVVLASSQIKLQAATAVLAQANLSSEMALKLLEHK